MSTELDVYRNWLGVKETERPLNYYQLLKLKEFEDDPVRIRHHYRKLNAHIRKYAAGDFAKQSQDLLNELAKAMLCLTDAGRKEDYDASLGRKVTSGSKRRGFEQLLVARKVLSLEQLEKARKFANAVGLDVRDAVTQQNMAKPEVAMQIYAESLGLPYVELGDIGVEESIAPKIPALLARQHTCVPVMVDEGQLFMASPNPIRPDVEEELRLRTGLPIRTVLCTASGINNIIGDYYPKSAASAELAGGETPLAVNNASDSPASSETVENTPPKENSKESAEAKKQRRLAITMIVYGLTIAIYYFGIGSGGLPVAILAGLVVAGIAYAVTG